MRIRLRTGIIILIGSLLMLGGSSCDDVARVARTGGDDVARANARARAAALRKAKTIFKKTGYADDFVDDAGRYVDETDDLAQILTRNQEVVPDVSTAIGSISDDLSRQYDLAIERARSATASAACNLAFDFVQDGDFDTTWQSVAESIAAAFLIPPNPVSQLVGYAKSVFGALDTYAKQGNYGLRMLILKYQYCGG